MINILRAEAACNGHGASCRGNHSLLWGKRIEGGIFLAFGPGRLYRDGANYLIEGVRHGGQRLRILPSEAASDR